MMQYGWLISGDLGEPTTNMGKNRYLDGLPIKNDGFPRRTVGLTRTILVVHVHHLRMHGLYVWEEKRSHVIGNLLCWLLAQYHLHVQEYGNMNVDTTPC